MRADNKLSLAASVLSRARRMESSTVDDLRAFGAPSECYKDAFRGIDRELDAEIKALGFESVDSALSAIAERTSDRWVYFNL